MKTTQYPDLLNIFFTCDNNYHQKSKSIRLFSNCKPASNGTLLGIKECTMNWSKHIKNKD